MKLFYMIIRNIKLFFKDKGIFFASLCTPVILLILYGTFLGRIYKDSIEASMPSDVNQKIIDALVGGEIISSILSVSAVTVSFCSNIISVNDKITGAIKDISISPIKNTSLSLSYFIASVCASLIVCYIALGACLVYMCHIGWYMTVSDIVLLAVDIFLLVLFGTSLSSIINVFLTTQGQVSAVSTIVSSGYGFICGAYMPISNFGTGLQHVLSFLPSTYGTSLVRMHALKGAIEEFQTSQYPDEIIEQLKNAFDLNIAFFDTTVPISAKYIYLILSIICLIAGYIFLQMGMERKNR